MKDVRGIYVKPIQTVSGAKNPVHIHMDRSGGDGICHKVLSVRGTKCGLLFVRHH